MGDLDPRTSRQEARRRQIRRRRLTAAVVAGVALLAALAGAWAARGSDDQQAAPSAQVETGADNETAPSPTTTQEAGEASPPAKPEKPSSRTKLVLRETLGGDISPKSVESSGTGLIFAQNMMYRHSVTVYDAETLELRKTIPDAVRLADFGYERFSGEALGAPVEAAFSPDGSYAYVSNYSMYGEGFGPEGDDGCTPASGYDDSFVYRISLETLDIDDAYRVGAVPKVVAVTPDGRFVLVANWCTWDLSVISTRRGREVRRIPMGEYPRGIAVSESGDAAYVAIMGGSTLVRVDLRTWETSSIPIGSGPRALEIDPSGKWIYATLNAEGRVAKLNLRTGRVKKVSTGTLPRSLAMSEDAKALYVVNYESGTVSKLRTLGPEGAADDLGLLPPDRDHVRRTHTAGVGRVLRRLAARLQRPPLGASQGDGASGIRTRDLLAASQTLSQLSYGPLETFSLPGDGELDRGDVAPELFEPVVLAGLGGEDVEDDVEVVGEDPPRLALPGDGARQQPLFLLQALADLVVDGLRLTRALPGAEDEEVRVRAHGPHVEDDDVGRELLLRERRDSAGVLDRRQWPGISWVNALSVARPSRGGQQPSW